MNILSLKQMLHYELNEHKEFWNYYGYENADPFESIEDARRFIYQYFEHGSKERALINWEENGNEDNCFRDIHTIIVFFIGVMIQRKIDENIAIVSESSRESYPFSYYWFLACLAHDFGYFYENKNIYDIQSLQQEYKNRMESREKRLKRNGYEKICLDGRRWMYQKLGFNITNLTPSMYKIIRKYCQRKSEECKYKEGICFNNDRISPIDRAWYYGEEKELYFRYRLFQMGKLDHGIVGADMLFSRLMENYHEQFEKNRLSGDYHNFTNNENKHFSCDQFKIFAYIANAIAAHNVFKAEEETVEIYKEYKLKRLLPDQFRDISYEKDPLLFVLCVADTLEPTKKFRGWDFNFILENITIDYNAVNNSVTVCMSETLAHTDEGKEYLSNVKKLPKWCKINIG